MCKARATVCITEGLLSSTLELTRAEQSRVLVFIRAFQRDPSHTSHRLKPVRQVSGLWSARASLGLRIILCKDNGTWFLLHASKREDVYGWVKRRKATYDPTIGALRIVETVTETVTETVAEPVTVTETVAEPVTVTETVTEIPLAERPGLFDTFDDAYLLAVGLPRDWIYTLRHVKTEDQLLGVLDDIPLELAEALITLASGDILAPKWYTYFAHRNLSLLEQGEFLSRREQELVVAGLRARSSAEENQHTIPHTNNHPEGLVTTRDIGRELGLQERTAQRRLQIARCLSQEVRELIRPTRIANQGRTLLQLARIQDPKEQLRLARQKCS